MSVIYRLIGYDPKTEMLAIRHDIPAEKVGQAKRVAGINIDDDTYLGDRKLDPQQAQQIAKLIGTSVRTDWYDFFLEPYVMGAAA